MEAHRLAPGRFSWKKYPDQINLELIRVFLSERRRKRMGSLSVRSERAGGSPRRDFGGQRLRRRRSAIPIFHVRALSRVPEGRRSNAVTASAIVS